MDSTSLVDMSAAPVVPVVRASGDVTVLSIPDTLDQGHRIAGIAAEDPLVAAALTHLLLACVTAAHTAGQAPGQWARSWLAGIAPTGEERPFLGAPVLAQAATWETAGKAPTVLDIFAAGDGPTLIDTRHHVSGWTPVDQGALLRLIVARQVFDVGGLHPYPRGTSLGKGVGYVSTTPGLLHPSLTVDTGVSLGDDLAASLLPDVVGAPAPYATFPPDLTPGQRAHPGGVAQGLLWPSRAVLAHRDGRVMFAGGLIDDRDPTDAAVPAVYPHAVYVTGAKGERAAPRATADPYRAARTLALAWTDATPVGLIAHLRHNRPHPQGWALRWRGLAAFQSRVDAVMDVRLPIPSVPDEAFTHALTSIEEVRSRAVKTIYAAAGGQDSTRGRLLSAFVAETSPPLANAVSLASTDPDGAVRAATDAVDDARTRAAGTVMHLRDLNPATWMEPRR